MDKETQAATAATTERISKVLDYQDPATPKATESTLDDMWGNLPVDRWKNTGRIWHIQLTNIATSASLGDSFHSIVVPPVFDGAVVVAVAATVVTSSAAGGPLLIQLNNGSSDMLTTRINIADSTKVSWATGTTQPVIDQTQAVLRAGTQIDFDIDDIGDGNAFGWSVFILLQ